MSDNVKLAYRYRDDGNWKNWGDEIRKSHAI